MKTFLWLIAGLSVMLWIATLPSFAADAKDDPFPKTVDAGGAILFSTGEGSLERNEVDDQVGWTITGGGFIYGDIKQAGSTHLRLDITLHDGGFHGNIGIPYDSTDDSVIAEARYPGAWKNSAISLEGKNAWSTVSVDWPDARLAHRCNNHDFRIELPRRSNITVKEIRVTNLPSLLSPVQPVHMPLSPVKMTEVAADGDMIRLPGRFAQR